MRKAVYAGSFDPFTMGHWDIVRRAVLLFDEVVVLAAQNQIKKGFLDPAERATLIEESVADFPQVSVACWDGLTVDFMRSVGAQFLIRGVRNGADLEWEQSVAWANQRLYPEVETVLLPASPEFQYLSSTMVRELLTHQADVTGLVPATTLSRLQAKCLH